MATTIVFDLISQLVETFTAATTDVNVYDGQGATDDPGNFLMVGVSDPDEEGESEAATSTQEWNGLGHKAATELGAVSCCALAWRGEVGSDAQRQVREDVRDLVAGVDSALKADPNLGGTVPGLNWVRYGATNTLRQFSGSEGVRAVFYFEIAYRAHI